jgi:hypothetical protein
MEWVTDCFPHWASTIRAGVQRMMELAILERCALATQQLQKAGRKNGRLSLKKEERIA